MHCLQYLRTALLKVDFESRRHSRVPEFYSTFVKKSTLLDLKSGEYDRDSTPPGTFGFQIDRTVIKKVTRLLTRKMIYIGSRAI